jgi:hypothetical protein
VDWKYKHFNHQAVFNARDQSVLEAARTVVAESFGAIDGVPGGLAAHGYLGLHEVRATLSITAAAAGTQLAVELLVERATMRGYMLVDIGGYYDGQIDRWFSRIAGRLGGATAVISKTTTSVKVRRGCLTASVVWLVVGAGLGALTAPLSSFATPLAIAASVIALVSGIGAFIYVAYPDTHASQFIRGRLFSGRKDRPF